VILVAETDRARPFAVSRTGAFKNKDREDSRRRALPEDVDTLEDRTPGPKEDTSDRRRRCETTFDDRSAERTGEISGLLLRRTLVLRPLEDSSSFVSTGTRPRWTFLFSTADFASLSSPPSSRRTATF
jgi:hypothetical protein